MKSEKIFQKNDICAKPSKVFNVYTCIRGRKKKARTYNMKRKIVCVMLCGIVALGSIGCGSNKMSAETVDLTSGARTVTTPVEKDLQAGSDDGIEDAGERKDLAGQQGTDRNPAEEKDEFAAYYADFAIEMLKNSAEKEENCMISPLSLMTALSMTENGAVGDTLTEMEDVIAGGVDVETHNRYLSEFCKSLPDTDGAKLKQANSIWFRNDREELLIEEAFLQKNVELYDAGIYESPFDEKTLADINTWVKDKTDGMIPTILSQINDEDVMYLINAVTFDAKWETEYEAYQEHEGLFTKKNGETQNVSMMNSEEGIYLSDENTTGFVKPYKDGYSFVGLLPEEGVSVESYLEELNGEKFRNLLANANYGATVYAMIPEFEAEYSKECKEVLSEMGMPLAFDGMKADFTNLGHSAEDHNLYISMVLHKTYIKVDTEGTKAAAVTAVTMADCATAITEKEIYYVHLNRPFVYAIIEDETGLPIFIGVTEEIDK